MEKPGKRVIITHVNPRVTFYLAKLIEPFVGDVLKSVLFHIDSPKYEV